MGYDGACTVYKFGNILTFHLDLSHRYIHSLLFHYTSMEIYILHFCLDCYWLLGIFDLKLKRYIRLNRGVNDGLAEWEIVLYGVSLYLPVFHLLGR